MLAVLIGKWAQLNFYLARQRDFGVGDHAYSTAVAALRGEKRDDVTKERPT